jgi:hypothetical protein
MLITYHRPWDAKLMMLTIPACAILWAEGGPIAWVALLVNSMGMVLTGDIPLAVLSIVFNQLHISTTGIFGRMLTLVMLRPASLILLLMSIFYLWVYLWRTSSNQECGMAETISAASGAAVKTE